MDGVEALADGAQVPAVPPEEKGEDTVADADPATMTAAGALEPDQPELGHADEQLTLFGF